MMERTAVEVDGEGCDVSAKHDGEVEQYCFVVKYVPIERYIAVFGAKKIYSLVNGFRHCGRKAARDVFFRELEYIMVEGSRIATWLSKILFGWCVNSLSIRYIRSMSTT